MYPQGHCTDPRIVTRLFLKRDNPLQSISSWCCVHMSVIETHTSFTSNFCLEVEDVAIAAVAQENGL
jgi:hypothetical protein